ncbi:hypothetical protein C400_15530 [Paenibacillus sp. ICGEB2008]|nr:hypothetical protein C400_15530 [Paenibacillus sp. ICGEB2008]
MSVVDMFFYLSAADFDLTGVGKRLPAEALEASRIYHWPAVAHDLDRLLHKQAVRSLFPRTDRICLPQCGEARFDLHGESGRTA